MTTDWERLLGYLSDGEWHSRTEILRRDFDSGNPGMTVHSRASDLRRFGYRVECKFYGGRDWRYRLTLDEGESAMPNAGPISPSSSVTEGAPTLAVYGQGGRRAGSSGRVGRATLSEGEVGQGHSSRAPDAAKTSGSPSESVEGDTARDSSSRCCREVAGMPDGASLTGSGQGMQPQSASRPSPASGPTPCPEQLSLDVVRAEEELAAAGQSAWGPWERGENW